MLVRLKIEEEKSLLLDDDDENEDGDEASMRTLLNGLNEPLLAKHFTLVK